MLAVSNRVSEAVSIASGREEPSLHSTEPPCSEGGSTSPEAQQSPVFRLRDKPFGLRGERVLGFPGLE